ncbi:MAG: cytochrome c biogenesis protein CcmE [Ferrovum sp. 37-45-19]|uniref:cytochrome c maturation protein CcmE n=1 Tax=Ferrovum sp. JA12 TaxID=1356299 RepID=UPI000702DD7D|nr:cytochrome c maturation protein CcmE [Ferrovum sp. JA12]OYV79758.1 MAG: cytochrome c biogenesis protein CcmE [Ferrovum sp. 21-44-67]OYV95380.1 MAG: cytochrome c biogenesis protein CcmE [Ferrovum sp. 37-45-19]OZB31439.1 MAG: cytochrome c biogenesis protein CcmE [Ferrovum sp. 34-44-207]HQT81171.1 cytochrome c maturation protein CcmE [Ferrovaceae bacterium]KRH78057.1 cytochrome c-type biogenesis protein CcmE [Ferrovum sp. JA12]
MKPRQKRLFFILGAMLVLGVAATFVVKAFRSNLVFFYTPTQIANGEAPHDRAFRIGGLVKQGTLKHEGVVSYFVVTDTRRDFPVSYTGILPDLFKEGRGVVAEGKLGNNGMFVASEVLAKHDSNYMPPEAKAALDQAKQVEQTSKTLKMN